MLSDDLKYKILEFDDYRQKHKDWFIKNESLLKSFVSDFPVQSIKQLTFDQYVIGHNDHNAFCHRLERELGTIGDMRGANSTVFGLYYGKYGEDKTKKDRFSHKYGNSINTALQNILTLITDLLIAGKNNDFNAIEKNKIAPLYKYKLLGTYFPDKYMNLYSEEHINYFLSILDLDAENKTFIEKQQQLFLFRDNTPIMRNWSNLEFNHFLYTNWRPPSKKERQKAKEVFESPEIANSQLVELEILPLPVEKASDSGNKKSGKPDYDKIYQRNKKYGKAGELVVLKHENEILLKYNLKAEHTSEIDDYAGYDILSFEADKTPKYIEVKSTSNKVGATNFIISDNELKQAKKLPNYHIYIVFEVNSKNPKIWKLDNPFKKDNPNIRITPKDFNVFINSQTK